MPMSSAWFDRTDLTVAAYCGYCRKSVVAHGIELVIDGEPELDRYICPKCRGTIGRSRPKDFERAVLIIGAIILVVGHLIIWMTPY